MKTMDWKWSLVLSAALGCGFEHGVLVEPDGGQDNAYEVNCECTPPPVTQTFTVATSSDDAEETVSSGNMDLASSDLEFTFEGGSASGQQLVGIRFGPLGIPQGSTILSARIQFTVDETTSTATSLQIQAQATDNAPTFTAADDDISSRPRGSASVAWTPPPWNVLDVAGPDQLTPELAPVLQQLVDRLGWNPESAAAIIVSGTGLRVAWSFDRSPANAPRLVVQYQEPTPVQVTLGVCVPPELNPNLVGGHLPTPAELDSDSSNRVQPTLSGLAGACGYPSLCTCAVVPDAGRFATSCDDPCVEVPLAPNCTNFDPVGGSVTATNADGDTPVCTAHSPLASAIYGRRTRCEVSGTATVEVEDEDDKTPATSGVIEFVGRPCPGQSCSVGMEYALDLEPVTYSRLFGSATFRELMSVGASGPGRQVVLDGAGNGSFAPASLEIGARGQRDGDFSKAVGTNEDALAVGVSWSNPAPVCEVVGAMVGNADPELKRCEPAGPNANAICTTDDDCADDPACSDEVCNCLPVAQTEVALSINVNGPVVNRPPTANAGPDQTVECNVAGGGRFQLQSLSSDLDDNLALTRWYLNSRTGPEVGFAPRTAVQQAVGSSAAYVLRVIDRLAQTDEDVMQVQVVDTTPPTLSCNAPATIRPGDHGRSFTATARDVCDPGATPIVTAYRCAKKGKEHPCKVNLAGDTVTIVNPSGVGTRISWDLSVTDASGNVATQTCAIDVATH